MQVDVRDMGLLPGLGRAPGGGHGNPHQYSHLDRKAWWATVHRVAKSHTWPKQLSTHNKQKDPEIEIRSPLMSGIILITLNFKVNSFPF